MPLIIVCRTKFAVGETLSFAVLLFERVLEQLSFAQERSDSEVKCTFSKSAILKRCEIRFVQLALDSFLQTNVTQHFFKLVKIKTRQNSADQGDAAFSRLVEHRTREEAKQSAK